MTNDNATSLNPPYGGELVQLMASDERAGELSSASRDWPSWTLSHRQMCDLELLLTGAFSPLQGFMNRADYEGVLGDEMRLADGTLWPLPITLDVSEAVAGGLSAGDPLCLRDEEGVMLAVLHTEQAWQPDLSREAERVFGTTSADHPGVAYLLRQTAPWYVGGRLEGASAPGHFDFKLLRHSPAEARQEIARRGWRRVMAFSTRNPIHRVHVSLTRRAAREHQTNLLLHPVVGMTKPGDVDHFTRVRCYQAALPRFSLHNTMLSLLNLSMRMAGPREALLHAMVRRNYGCTHFLVGRDQAGPGVDGQGKPHYEPYAAQELLQQHEDELGIRVVPVKEAVYVHARDEFAAADEVAPDLQTTQISGTSVRADLARGLLPPSWYSYPEVIKELRRTYPPRHGQGFTVFFTGLSGAGKSTLAKVLLVRLLELGGRPVTLLDGDIVRQNLSSELTFSKEHRDINIRRIGFVASEITKNKGIAICAPIAPFDRVRQEVKEMISQVGGYVLVHVATPLTVCEERDCKGMYAKARAGIIKGFTGIDDPYEVPEDAQLNIDTTGVTPNQCVQQILLFLEKEGYVGQNGGAL